MRHEPSACIDHVRITTLAYLDLRHDGPDELEVHFGKRDGAIAGCGGHRDGHLRLGLIGEVERAEMDTRVKGGDKPGMLREVRVAVGPVRVQAGDAQSLAPACVQEAHGRDGWRQTQQLEVFDAPPREIRGANTRCRHRRPFNLAREVLDVARDGRRRGLCLVVLGGVERRAALPMGDVNFERPAREQRSAHQPHDQESVFREQPPAVLHSMKRVARSTKGSGSSSSRLFAVLRLTTRSK